MSYMSSTRAHQAGLQAQQRCLAPPRASGSHPAVVSGTGHCTPLAGRESAPLSNTCSSGTVQRLTRMEGSAGFDDSGIFVDNSAATNNHSEPLGFNHGTRDLMAVSDCSLECPAQEDFVAREPASYDVPPGFEAGADNCSDGFSYLDDTPGRQHSPADNPQPASPFVGDACEGSRSDGCSYMGDPPSRSPSPPPRFSDIEPEPQHPASPDIADPDVIDVAGDPLYADIETLFDELLEDDPGAGGGTHPAVYKYLSAPSHPLRASPHTQCLSALPETAGFEVPGLDKMAQTLRTVERRLGVDPDRTPGEVAAMEDGPGHLPPRPCEDWEGWENPGFRMFDIMDGWRWHAITADLERRRGGPWGVEDVDAHHIGQLRCTAKRSCASDQPGLVPHNEESVRFRREETILYCVIPGPGEPTTQQLNQILKPLHVELTRLYDGVLFRLPGEETEEPVTEAMHAYLSNISSDLPATHKLNGLRCHTSEHFMFPAFTDDLPDWLPGRDSLPDFMHAAYLGEAKHVIQGILGKGGMFTQMNRRNKPLEKLYAYLGAIRWPPGFARPSAGAVTAEEEKQTCGVTSPPCWSPACMRHGR
ncbi:hypothetical protein NUW54_g3792 [Trametes sanguinea]|uniref:Uncharacterized protein n=1 Tax=Trametes sanguinea TaxID=158606 RepID=A0ACC1PZR1_9APHY|nr:hypothetical protein NUW54_g3792 [Trametes sanguinea]